MHRTHVAIALTVLAGLTVSGCLRLLLDPDPYPEQLVMVPPAEGAVLAAYRTAIGNRKFDESLELADVLRAEMAKAGANDVEAYLTADGFRCDSQICTLVEVYPRKYQLGGAYNPDFVVSVWAIAYSDPELNAGTQLRGHIAGGNYREPWPNE